MIKTIIIGPSESGKTSICEYLKKGVFTERYFPTIGAQLFILNLTHKGETISFSTWDSTGDPRFQHLIEGYIGGAYIIIFVYAIDRYYSFNEMKDLYLRYSKCIRKDAKVYILGNKRDLKRSISRNAPENFAKFIGGRYLETSAKTGIGLDDLIEAIHFDLDNHCMVGREIVVIEKEERGCLLS